MSDTTSTSATAVFVKVTTPGPFCGQVLEDAGDGVYIEWGPGGFGRGGPLPDGYEVGPLTNKRDRAEEKRIRASLAYTERKSAATYACYKAREEMLGHV